MKFGCNDAYLVIHRGRPRENSHSEFARQVLSGLHRMQSLVSTSSCNMFFQTHRETDYFAGLNGIPSSTIDEWSGMQFVAHNAWV